MSLYRVLFDSVMIPYVDAQVVDATELDSDERERLYYSRIDRDAHGKDRRFNTIELPDSRHTKYLEDMGAIVKTTEDEATKDHIGTIDATVAGASGPHALSNVEMAASMDSAGKSAKPSQEELEAAQAEAEPEKSLPSKPAKKQSKQDS